MRRRASRPSAPGPVPTSRTTRSGSWSPALPCSSAGTATGGARWQAPWPSSARYVDEGIVELANAYAAPHPLALALQAWVGEIAALGEGESLDLRPADYFYRLLALDPFAKRGEERERRAQPRDLLPAPERLPELLPLHRRHAPQPRVPALPPLQQLPAPAPRRRHQRVRGPRPALPQGPRAGDDHPPGQGAGVPGGRGRLASARSFRARKQIDRDLGPFYHRPPFEPENRITLFDRMRLHYVAFSRPQKVLVLTAHEAPKDHFAPIWQGLPQWPYVQKDLLAAQRFDAARADARQEDLQLHRRPQDLRDLPAPVPVLPRVRLHAVPFGGDLLRPARAPDHRGNPPHRARRQARHARRAAHPRAVRPHLPLPLPERRAAHRRHRARVGLPPGR